MNHSLPTRRLAIAGASLVATLALAAPASAATSVQVDNRTLEVNGDDAGNQIVVYPQQNDVVVDIGDDGVAEFTAHRAAFDKIEVRGGGGDDRLFVQYAGAFELPITLDGGSGNDDLRGGAFAETLIGGTGDDVADGNLGQDTVRLGSGNDRFNWDPGDSNDTVEGETGTDAVDFNGANIGEQIDLVANGERVRLTRNVANITLDLGGFEQAKVRTVGGADNVNVGNLAGTGLRSADVDLRGFDGNGDAQADTVTLSGTDAADRFNVGGSSGKLLLDGAITDVTVTAAEAQDHAKVAALGEADTIVNTVADVPGPGQIDVDGGDGDDRAFARGGDGDDQIGIAPNGAGTVATFGTGTGVVNHVAVESLTVQGLAGADQLGAINGIGGLTALTLDGGEGDDDLRGANGADQLVGGGGNDRLDGNLGADTAKLGAGDDAFIWDPGDASDVVEGSTGADKLEFNASNAGEQIDVVRNGGRVKVTRNIGTVTLDVNDVEASAFRMLGGADQVTVGDLSGTDLKAADVSLAASLGGGDSSQDTVIVNGREVADKIDVTADGGEVVVDGLPAITRISGSESLNVTLRVNALGGTDTVTVDPDAELLITPVIDLGIQ
ncbi:MAG TPA: hypothetical protein VFT09_12390 [Ilumatobacteraceae bacterium]|nr:hypothetical protein [Ilumatobacteraceae bacterium]